MTRSDSPRSTSHSRSVPSSLPLSRWRLSGVKVRLYTSARWPCSTTRDVPSWPSHSRIVWSKLPLASVPPSGLQARVCTCFVCPTSVWRRRWLRASPTSHSLTVPSQLALASLVPLGAKASPRTQLLCPTSVCTQVVGPVCCLSHSRIVPATSPLASRRSSGLQASERTAPGCGNSCRGVPSFASHSRTVASDPPLASRSPAGAKARQVVPFVCQPVQSKARLSTSHSLRLLSRLPLARVRSSGLKAIDVTMSVWACQTRVKVWPASRHTRTSPRWLAAAQYCPLRLMAPAVMASKVSVKTHSRIKAPESRASCSSTPCKYTPRRVKWDRSRPRRSPRSSRSSATRLARPYPWASSARSRNASSPARSCPSTSIRPWYMLSRRASSGASSSRCCVCRTYSLAPACERPCSRSRSSRPCLISWLAVVTSLLVTYSSTWTCASLDTS